MLLYRYSFDLTATNNPKSKNSEVDDVVPRLGRGAKFDPVDYTAVEIDCWFPTIDGQAAERRLWVGD